MNPHKALLFLGLLMGCSTATTAQVENGQTVRRDTLLVISMTNPDYPNNQEQITFFYRKGFHNVVGRIDGFTECDLLNLSLVDEDDEENFGFGLSFNLHQKRNKVEFYIPLSYAAYLSSNNLQARLMVEICENRFLIEETSFEKIRNFIQNAADQ